MAKVKTNESPFIFGKIPQSAGFVNRTAEIERLSSNFRGCISSVLISPRRWGKTSLVYHVSELTSSKDHKVIHLNLQRIRTEEEFYNLLVSKVIQATISKTEEKLGMIKKLLQRLRPAIRLIGLGQEVEVTFGRKDIHQNRTELLDVAEKIAQEKDITITVCIDEFQDITNFESSREIQNELRAAWQHHQKVGYCLYGSRQHMMETLFQDSDRPFYKFGDYIQLRKIDKVHWVRFIMDSFQKTSKSIPEEVAAELVSLMESHSFYVQHLAHQTWHLTTSACTHDTLQRALMDLITQHEIHYDRLASDLPNKQIAVLRAVVQDEKALYSKEVIQKYNLSSSSTVSAAIKGLQQKEIMDY
ncbi:MAG: ATP-binding protein, partial [Bacteroidota bacterium]